VSIFAFLKPPFGWFICYALLFLDNLYLFVSNFVSNFSSYHIILLYGHQITVTT